MTIVVFKKPYKAFNPGEIAGVTDDEAIALLSNDGAELHGDGTPREEDRPETPANESNVIVQFTKRYGVFNPGEIAGLSKAEANKIINLKGATLYKGGKLRDASKNTGGRPKKEPEAPSIPFSDAAIEWFKTNKPDLNLEHFEKISELGVNTPKQVVENGRGWLEVKVTGVGKATAEKIILACSEYADTH